MSLFSGAVGAGIGFAAAGLPGLIAGGLIGDSIGGNVSSSVWTNQSQIASNRAKESEQYKTTNNTVGNLKSATGVTNLSELDAWLKVKADEQNTVTQTRTVDTGSFLGIGGGSKTTYQYWQESNDQLLSRYGYETYAQKATNLSESLKWMEVKDMNKLNSNVLLAEVSDTAGQNVERQIASNQMNNYFGQYYVDATKV